VKVPPLPLPVPFESVALLRSKSTSTSWRARDPEGLDVVVRVGAELEGWRGIPLARLAAALWDARAVTAPIAHERAVLERLAGPGVPALAPGYGEQERLLVTSWIDGAPLADATPLAPPRGRRLLRALLEVTARAHAVGVVHRDISPSNVLVDAHDEARVWLIDWELAATPQRRPFGPVGTRGFIAPEQLALRAQPRREVTAAADVFAIGATLYYALTGRVPYGRTSLAIVNGEPLDVRAVPEELRSILQAMLARDEAERPPDAAAALALLDDRDTAFPVVRRPVAMPLADLLARVDAGDVVTAARGLDAIALNNGAGAALGYAYLAARLGDPEMAATLLLGAPGDDPLRTAIARHVTGLPSADGARDAASPCPRTATLHAEADWRDGAWVAAYQRVLPHLDRTLTQDALRHRVDALTRDAETLSGRLEVAVWASLLAVTTPAGDARGRYEDLAIVAYPGPGHDPLRLADHAFVVAAGGRLDQHASAVARVLAEAGDYGAHERLGVLLDGFEDDVEARCASLVELGLRAAIDDALAQLPAERWRCRARLQLATGRRDEARVTLERVHGDARQSPAFCSVHMAQLIQAGRVDAAVHVYDRAAATLTAEALARLTPLAGLALVRARQLDRAETLLPALEASDASSLARRVAALVRRSGVRAE
jgi:hypothetical protein